MNILVNIAGFIGNISASKVATDIIKNLLPNVENASKVSKVLTFIGTLTIGGIVGDAAQQYVEKEVGQVTNLISKLSKNDEDDSAEEGDN